MLIETHQQHSHSTCLSFSWFFTKNIFLCCSFLVTKNNCVSLFIFFVTWIYCAFHFFFFILFFFRKTYCVVLLFFFVLYFLQKPIVLLSSFFVLFSLQKSFLSLVLLFRKFYCDSGFQLTWKKRCYSCYCSSPFNSRYSDLSWIIETRAAFLFALLQIHSFATRFPFFKFFSKLIFAALKCTLWN